jgi:small-conductance mechanosensitive channel
MQRIFRYFAFRTLCTPLLIALVCAVCTTGVNAEPQPSSDTSAASDANAPANASAAAPVALTPAQARTALRVLDDPVQRAHLADTLRAIAAAGALAAPASAPAATSAPASASAAVSASAPLARALRSNGLVLQIADHAARSARMLGERLLHTRLALFDMGSARDWWTNQLQTTEGRAMLLDLLRVLLLTLAPALIVEALMRRVMKRPHRAIIAYAKARLGDTSPARQSSANSDAEREAQSEALRAAAGMGTDEPPATANAPASPAAREKPAGVPPRAVLPEAPSTLANVINLRSKHHWKRLQRLPAALLLASLELLPVITFGLCAAGVLSLFHGEDAALAAAVGQLVDTYVTCRIIIAVGALLFAPDADALRLMPLSDASAAFAQRWTKGIVVIGGVGGALSAAVPLGLTDDALLALIKVVALVGHLALAVMIVQCHRPVADAIRRSTTGRGSLAYLGHWLADIWSGVAVFVVIALWLVWAFDVRGGYRDLVREGGVSLAVLLVARVVAIVVLGALGRLFDPLGNRDDMTIVRRRVYRYYPALRRLATLALWLVTLDVLLHVWGVHPGGILVNASIGRLLGSALMTIIVAILVAVVTWEAANAGAERRLQAWTDAGDYVRAARLRTLLPMFRTTLFVAILIIVGLTALSQLGINTAPLIAGASIFGVALGFGSQKLVQDFITGIFLLTENAMQVGDWVTVAGVSGTVEFLSIRTVRLRGGDGSLYTVPFSSVTTVNNTNRGIGNAAVKVAIAYGADVQCAIDTMKEIGAELRTEDKYKDGILSDFAYWGVDQVDGASVTLVGQIQCTDSTRWSVQREFNRRLLERFTARGIALANPQRNFVVGVPGAASAEGETGSADAPDDEAEAEAPATRRTAREARPRHGQSGDGHGGPADAGRKPS